MIITASSVDCGSPPTVAASTSPTSPSTLEGDSVLYTCDTGYLFPDETTTQSITCQSDGICDPIQDCLSQYNFLLSADYLITLKHVNIIFFFKVVYLPLIILYIITASSVDCGSPPSVAFSTSPTSPLTLEGDSVLYSCDSGYLFPDEAATQSITCKADGSWDTIQDCLSQYNYLLSATSKAINFLFLIFL